MKIKQTIGRILSIPFLMVVLVLMALLYIFLFLMWLTQSFSYRQTMETMDEFFGLFL